jgi:hypothetical protein
MWIPCYFNIFFSLKVRWVRPKCGCLPLRYHITHSPDDACLESDGGKIYWQGKNRRTRRKTCPSATLSTTNPTWIDKGANSGLRGERPATNDLSHGTAYFNILRSDGKVTQVMNSQLCDYAVDNTNYIIISGKKITSDKLSHSNDLNEFKSPATNRTRSPTICGSVLLWTMWRPFVCHFHPLYPHVAHLDRKTIRLRSLTYLSSSTFTDNE